MSQPLIAVMANARLRAWPKSPEGGRVRYLPLSVALTMEHSTDAHTAAYSVPSMERRLSRDAVKQLPDGVVMVLVIFDVDGPGHVAMPDWWASEKLKIAALTEEHPTPFSYLTRGGYRIILVLPEPMVLRTDENAAAWTAQYYAWCNYLLRRFGIEADRSCGDWQRLYRLPHATRTEGGQPERLEVIGDARRIGMWRCELAAEDLVVPDVVATRTVRPVSAVGGTYAGRGRLIEAFASRGWLGSEVEPGKYACRCPWAEEHSCGVDFDGSTIVMAASDSDLGWWKCSHHHKANPNRNWRDVLALFTDAEMQRRPLPPRCGARIPKSGKTCAATELFADGRCRFHSVTREAREQRRAWALTQRESVFRAS